MVVLSAAAAPLAHSSLPLSRIVRLCKAAAATWRIVELLGGAGEELESLRIHPLVSHPIAISLFEPAVIERHPHSIMFIFIEPLSHLTLIPHRNTFFK